MPFQPGAAVYSQGFGTVPAGVNYPIYLASVPNTSTIYGPNGVLQLGQIAIVPNTAAYVLLGISTVGAVTTANWAQIVSASGDILAVAGTTNQITAVTSAGTVTLSIPTTFIAPGSIASTTTLTGGTGITATTGNIVATAGNITTTAGSITSATTLTAGTGITSTTGNLTISGTASGLVTTPTVVSGASSGTVAGNGRVVSITFTGVSIASGATQAFTTSNTSITGSGTLLLLTWSGATAGSSLSVESIVNSANQSVITMTNGTSATMVTSVANITFNYFVLN